MGYTDGIRPVKIVHELMNNIFLGKYTGKTGWEYLVSRDRAELALKIAGIERPLYTLIIIK